MAYLNNYRNRVSLSSSDRLIDSSKKNVNKLFKSHPYQETVMVNGSQLDVVVSQAKKSQDKQLLLQPDTQIDIGSVVGIGINHYLVFDFLGEGINDIYPTATLKLCNSTYPIKRNKTSVLIGMDSDDRPVYKDEYEEIDEPCIVETTYSSGDGNQQLPLPEGNINITMKYQTADNIAINQTFTIHDETYEIRSIDHTKVINGKGIMVIRGVREVAK